MNMLNTKNRVEIVKTEDDGNCTKAYGKRLKRKKEKERK